MAIDEVLESFGLGFGLNVRAILLVLMLCSGAGGFGGAYYWTYTSADISYDLPANSRFLRPGADRIAEQSRWFGHRDTITVGALSDERDNLILTVDYPKAGNGGRYDRDFVAAFRSMPGRYQFSHMRDGYRYTLQTRWGRIAATGYVAASDAFRKNCLSFVSQFETRMMIVSGQICASPGRDVSPGEVACLVDGLRILRQPKEPAAPINCC